MADLPPATRHRLADALAAQGDDAARLCTGCGASRVAAIGVVIKGGTACCPDCSTLTVGERNTIREQLAQRDAARRAEEPSK